MHSVGGSSHWFFENFKKTMIFPWNSENARESFQLPPVKANKQSSEEAYIEPQLSLLLERYWLQNISFCYAPWIYMEVWSYLQWLLSK